VAVDTTGNKSLPTYTTVAFDSSSFGSVLEIILPYQTAWPGTKTSCFVLGTSLENVGASTWNDEDVSWATSTDTWGNTGASPIVYEHTVVDLTASTTVTIRANDLVSGASTIEYASSADDITYSAWAAIPAGTVTDRYFKFKWTVTGTDPIIYRAQVVFYV
jgi:hypothetical protein